jgi:DNA primase
MAEEQAQAAVLFADVSGSTKLYETAGDQVAKAAIDECVRIMRERTEATKGRVIKTIGDEVMSSFPTADLAADAAIQMQEAINELKPVGNTKIGIRIGFNFGPVMEREGGRLADRFRNRLMIPIARDSGAIVAFGGRALEEGQVPKYLNSPETPIYIKGRTLYGLDVTKAAIRKHNYCVLVEGYFDLAQVWQAGIQPVVASCGTALTNAQARVLKRFTSKVVLSFDPDAAGQGAASRSSEMLVSEGFQVNVALLPAGSDPDTFVRKSGGRAYVERLIGTIRRECLDWLIPLSERHLRRVLQAWVAHYNRGKPHSSLGPGIPDRPSAQLPEPSHRHRLPVGHRV